MKHITLICFQLIIILFTSAYAQTRIILDLDIDSDVDDVEALAMLHTLAGQKEIELLGIIVTSDDPYAPLCADAVNTYFGRKNLPVGFLKNQKELKNHSKYTRQISEAYPHQLTSYQDAADAVALYRKLLSNSPDESVVIVTIGHLSSLQQLLQSGADTYSSLHGKALAEKKVAKWICMGGMFPEGKEANFYRPDPLSTVYCLQNWNKPVTFCGWEVGNKIITGGDYLKSKLTTQSPVYTAYELYNGFAGRPSWDQVAILLLTDEWKRYFNVITDGYCFVNTDGSNVWKTDKDSKHAYLVFKPDAAYKRIAQYIDDMAVK